MEQYDGRIKAELAMGELRRQNEAQAVLYREVLGRCMAAEKDVAFYKKNFADHENRFARLNESYTEIQAKHEKAMGEISLLKQANAELTNRMVEAVETDRKTGEKLKEAEEETKRLHARICALQDQISLGNRDRYGATSEKTDAIFSRTEEEKDPIDEGANQDSENTVPDEGKQKQKDYSAGTVLKKIEQKILGDTGKKPRTPRPKGKREEDFSKLDQVNHYNYDLEELNRKYGKGKYRFVGFKRRQTLRETRPHNYVYNEYTPVIVPYDDDGKEKKIITLPRGPAFYPGSFASESLMTAIFTKRFSQSLPVYRLEKEYNSRNIPLSRETMTNWIIYFAQNFMNPVRDRMWKELDQCALVRQCDETPWRVIIWPEEEDPEKIRKNGSQGYLWVHTTGEFTKSHKVIIYAFEKSRSADHLRRTLKEMVGYLVSDAYAAYYTISDERGGLVKTVMCWMHCRRMLARAVLLMSPGLDELSVEEIQEAPEVVGLLLANAIFEVETPLKKLLPDERLKLRKKKVAPLVDKFFSFIHGIDLDDPALTERMREAVTYALNQEEGLRMFLENGEIPMDNGYVERCIKVIGLSRRSSLFSFSMEGADSNAIMYSIVETARANDADVYIYLRYLLSEMPHHMDDTDYSFLDDMMPWSLKYKLYEKWAREQHIDESMPESNEPPAGYKEKKQSGKTEDVA